MIDHIEKAAAAAGVSPKLIAEIINDTGCLAVEVSGALMRFQRITKSENVEVDIRRFKRDMQGRGNHFVASNAAKIFGRSAVLILPWIINNQGGVTGMIYVIDSNKKHSIVSAAEADRLHDSGYKIVQADADGWIEWTGGECPVPPDCGVEIKTLHGIDILDFAKLIPETAWVDRGLNAIVAYRPVLDAPAEAAPKWNGEGLPPVGEVCEHYANDQWQKCEVTKYTESYMLIWDYFEQWGYTERIDSSKVFRPIRTDREKWVKAASEVSPCIHDDDLYALCDAMLNNELPTPGASK